MGKGREGILRRCGWLFLAVDGWETLAGFASPGILVVLLLFGDQGTLFLFFVGPFLGSLAHFVDFFFFEAKMRDVVMAMAFTGSGM